MHFLLTPLRTVISIFFSTCCIYSSVHIKHLWIKDAAFQGYDEPKSANADTAENGSAEKVSQFPHKFCARREEPTTTAGEMLKTHIKQEGKYLHKRQDGSPSKQWKRGSKLALSEPALRHAQPKASILTLVYYYHTLKKRRRRWRVEFFKCHSLEENFKHKWEPKNCEAEKKNAVGDGSRRPSSSCV